MSWLSSIVIGVLTAAAGCFAAGFLGTFCVRWYRISSFEGGAGYYVLSFAFVGTLAGLIGGIVASRFVPIAEAAPFWSGLGWCAGGMVALVGAVGLVCRLAADLAPTLDGRKLRIVAEIRGGKSFTPPTKTDDYGAFASIFLLRGRRQSRAELDVSQAKKVDGRWVITVTVPLETSSSRKYFRAYFNQENDALFSLPLRSHPKRKDMAWSRWVDSAWNANEPEPPQDEKFNLRYRVEPVPPPAPRPSAAEIAAQQAAEEQAAFEAIAADAPLTAWLPHVRYGAPEQRRSVALQRMTARPDFVSELGGLMLASDADVAAETLRLVPQLGAPLPDLIDPVVEAGRDLIARLRKVNQTRASDDPGFDGAADVARRFSGWMEAVRTLREKAGGDFTPQLAEVLELSRVRPDSYVLRSDVLRVASYYLHEWAGVEPLPTDPKPR